MNTMNLIIIGNFFVGILQIILSLPLVFRQVPMNRMYGIRIRAAFESDQRWYDINAYGGRQLLIWSGLPLAAGAAGLFISPKHIDDYAYGSLALLTLAFMIPFILILIHSRRPNDTNERKLDP